MPEIWTIARFSFKEAVRKKVLAGALILAVGYITLYAYGLSKIQDFGNIPHRMVLTQMFSMALFGAGFIVALLVGGTQLPGVFQASSCGYLCQQVNSNKPSNQGYKNSY